MTYLVAADLPQGFAGDRLRRVAGPARHPADARHP